MDIIQPDRGAANRSTAWRDFVDLYFGEGVWALTRGEAFKGVLRKLTRDELSEARELLRQNLPLRYTHFIEGAADLGDVTAVPILRELLDSEKDMSRRLTIAGSLWRLSRDEVFAKCIKELVQSGSLECKEAHLDQILWLQDERALDLLIRLLEDDNSDFVRHLALSRLNEMETGESAIFERPFSADHYFENQNDPQFRRTMIEGMQRLVAKWHEVESFARE